MTGTITDTSTTTEPDTGALILAPTRWPSRLIGDRTAGGLLRPLGEEEVRLLSRTPGPTAARRPPHGAWPAWLAPTHAKVLTGTPTPASTMSPDLDNERRKGCEIGTPGHETGHACMAKSDVGCASATSAAELVTVLVTQGGEHEATRHSATRGTGSGLGC